MEENAEWGAFSILEGKLSAFVVFSFRLKVKFKSYHSLFSRTIELWFFTAFKLGNLGTLSIFTVEAAGELSERKS